MKIGKGRVRYFSKGGPEVDRLKKKRDERGSKKGDMRQRKGVGNGWMHAVTAKVRRLSLVLSCSRKVKKERERASVYPYPRPPIQNPIPAKTPSPSRMSTPPHTSNDQLWAQSLLIYGAQPAPTTAFTPSMFRPFPANPFYSYHSYTSLT